MKKFITLVLFTGFVCLANAQNAAAPQPASRPDMLVIKETQFDFGKIPQGKPVTHVFEIDNTGKDSLKIENIQASCGCTTPEWTRDPISPNGTKKVTVGYNAAAEGAFEKYITVFYNNGMTKQIIIKGQVWKTPAEPAPANASVQLLKNINQ